MAYIQRFEIRGLAGRDEAVVRVLDRHVNIFWGLNGTGKTSLLKILNSALTNQVGLLRRVPFESAEVDFFPGPDGIRLRRSITRASIDFDQDSEDGFGDDGTHLEPAGDGLWKEVESEPRIRLWETIVLEGEFPAERRTVTGRIVSGVRAGSFGHSYLPISRLTRSMRTGYARRGGINGVVDDAFLDDDFAEQVRQRWQLYNSEALARIRTIQQQGLANILSLLFGGPSQTVTASADSIPGETAYEQVKSFLAQQGIRLTPGEYEFKSRYEQQSELRAVVDVIEGVTRDAEMTLRPQREFQSTIERLYSGGKSLRLDASPSSRVSLQVQIDGEPIPLQSLSSGEKQLLRLLLEALAAGDSTVMIDEPELSMHVDWQQVLVASMRSVNPECQLLLATHSPEVMAEVADEHVFQL